MRYIIATMALGLPLFCYFLGIEIRIGPVSIGKGSAATPQSKMPDAAAGTSARLPPPVIATFTDKWPRSDLRTELGIFTDSKFLGRSSIWYETIQHPNQLDYFLRVHFRLDRGPRSLVPDAYCGIYTDWTQPPPAPVNASQYSGLSLRASYSLLSKASERPSFLLNLATLGTNDGEYHEANFTPQLPAPGSGFARIELPFSSFQIPQGVTTGDHPFDPSKVFRIAIVIKGRRAEGTLDLDDLAFMYRRQ